MGAASGQPPRVLAAESFLADIAQHVAGDRLTVDVLIPSGIDPHGFEPTPADVRKVADSDLLIINGAGLEAFLARLLESAGGERVVIEASAGLASREGHSAEAVDEAADEHADEAADEHTDEADHGHGETDPHFWLDPVLAIKYVENIRDALNAADPAGAETYTANAAQYIADLEALDAWIVEQVQAIPPERRLLVTNHESFGYFADRYGFTVLGAVVPSVSSAASPSAEQLARLVDRVKAAGARAIFIETGANPQMAQQLAQEAGVTVVSELLTHSVTTPDGPAPDYIAMIRYNVQTIVAALQ
jgi:ABC-type Zn uptake system ZnuABC Zn-binding protein ZnuA